MNRIWLYVTFFAILWALLTGQAEQCASAILTCGEEAVTLTLSLLGSMTLWSGLMEVLAESGDLARLSRLIRRLTGSLFGGLDDAESWSAIGMNLAANLLGLGNAATPAGVRAAQLLSAQGETGMRALAMLLAINNAGLQFMPTTIIAVRQAAGCTYPADVWLPALAASAVSTVVSAAMLLLMRKRRAKT